MRRTPQAQHRRSLEFRNVRNAGHNAADTDPLTWSVEPTALGISSITMTAATAADDSGVEYSFVNVTDASHNTDCRTVLYLWTPDWITTRLTHTKFVQETRV
jgi:hypothetical protein